ncbi:MAG: dTMP kinase [Candidatus Margulisbacteria bacterium]|nr:dTMP kinase [Candidatus Margulisiibacteriota bacterium]
MLFKKNQTKNNTEFLETTKNNHLYHTHTHKGILIVVEGTDGSGKSTQLHLLKKWLIAEGYPVVYTEWNSSTLVAKTIKKGKKKGILDSNTFSLLHATDFADRLYKTIIPALTSGHIVLADRYVFTALARDYARNCDRDWLRNLYSFAPKPDATFYFQMPVEVSLERITQTRQPKYYEAGMDMKLSSDPYKSYVLFQSKVISEYETMVDEFGLTLMDGMQEIHDKQVLFREKVLQIIKRKFK